MAEYEEIIEARGSDINNVAHKVLEYRGWAKTVSSNYRAYQTYADSEGILRPNFKIHGTKTTRLSCAEPALQQIPKETKKPWNGKLKKAFIPKRKGFVLLGRDYSQLEYRLGAGYANQENIIEAFNDVDRDVFSELAEELHRPRNDVKTLMYAKGYGAALPKLELLLGDGARQFIKNWEAKHNRMVALANRVNETAKSRGYIKLWTGRRRHFDYKSEARKGWNSLIQGGGAEIVKSAMIRCNKEFRNDPNCNLVLQVHDELLFEVKESELEYYDLKIKHLMESVTDEIDFGVHFKTESKIWA
jgi:DNA polymerase-1